MKSEAAEMLERGAEQLGIHLGVAEMELFSRYTELLQLWGSKMNLTSKLADAEVVPFHFLDSLSVLPLLTGEGRDLADIGAGAGFPALPLKICLPDLRILLVERSRKKVSFCQEIVRRLGLRDVRVLHGSGEEIGEDERYRGRFHWVVVRAVGESSDMADLSFPFLSVGGTAFIFKAALDGKERASLERTVRRLGASLRLQPVTVPYLEKPRTFAIIQKRST